ncbi:uncharacterized protein [Aegilops tauschii subsp. strangulata]|uniref:uncharacterized protein n=1 Tax=Aegilops tauschii subsp. strangulata TaxID=200361 RepID=UPI003CC84459
MAKHLTAWGQRMVGNIKLQIACANLVILRLDCTQEIKLLTEGERWLWATLKHLVLGLASLERTIARQRSRIKWLQEGNASTNLFHLITNGRKAKNFILAIEKDGEMITDQKGKEEAFFEALKEIMGRDSAQAHRGSGVSEPYCPGSLRAGLDLSGGGSLEGYQRNAVGQGSGAGWFHWDIFSKSLGRGQEICYGNSSQLFLDNGWGFRRLNQALISLIPKSPDACTVKDFRPICLVHNIPKIASKLLATSLCRRMPELVNVNQSAFIKGHSIHDNFLLVRQMARRLHKSKTKGVLLKLDISKAFDSLSWLFLFEVLRAKGFSDRWLCSIATLLSTASSRVMVNGCAGQKFRHACSLRQGESLSPLLFVIAMDVLTTIISKAHDSQILGKLNGCGPLQRLSLYADD